MRLAVAVTAKLDSLSDGFKFAGVTAEFTAFPNEKFDVVFGATVASLVNMGGGFVVYDGVANAFASGPGNSDDSVGGVVVVAADSDNRHLSLPFAAELRHG